MTDKELLVAAARDERVEVIRSLLDDLNKAMDDYL